MVKFSKSLALIICLPLNLVQTVNGYIGIQGLDQVRLVPTNQKVELSNSGLFKIRTSLTGFRNMAALFDNYTFVLQYRQKQKQLNFTWELNHTEHVSIQMVKQI